MLKDKIISDLKAAMLSGDKQRAEALKMVKSAITYKEVELGSRDSGLTDEQVVDVLLKESKKRSDAAEMYEKADRTEQAAAELFEQNLIAEYLPAQVSDDDIRAAVDQAIADLGEVSSSQMGQVIGAVKAKLGKMADGAKIAAFVKEKLS